MTFLKRLFTGLLTGALLCTAVPFTGLPVNDRSSLTASAVSMGTYEESYGDLKYTIYCPGDGVSIVPENALYIAITDCDPSAVSVTIPREIDGVPITAIEANAFAECTSLSKIEIPDTIIDIGTNALNDTPYFQNLKAQDPYVIINGILVDCPQRTGDIVVPDGVTIISGAAFDHREVTSVVLPDSVTRIGSYAFYYAENLTSINMPKNLKSIGRNAFHNCKKLPNLQFPEGLTRIEMGAFESCHGFTELVIPEGVTEVSYDAFENCYRVKTLTLPSTLRKIKDQAFSGLGCTSVQIPEGVTEIGEWAFGNCKELTEISIPSTVTSFGEDAFFGTLWLKAQLTETPLLILNHILIDGTTCQGDVTIPADVTTIVDGAFSGNETLTGITIPETVQEIGVHVFQNCTKLERVSLPDNMSNIPEDMFHGCTSLKHITIPKSVTVIEDFAFCNCKSLESITLTNNLHFVEHYAFENCKSLSAIYFKGTREEWEQVEIWTANEYLKTAALYCYAKGDVNVDGTTDITDLVLLSQFLIDAVELNDLSICNADCNEDTLVDVDDTLCLLQQLMQQS